MQIEALKLFCDVARMGSFSRSAEIHNVTQSTASQAVHGLEKDLGATLIDRSRRPWTLTPAGKTFYDGCRELVERFDHLERRVRGRPAAGGELRVAAIYSVGLRHMREFIGRFSKASPRTRVHLDYMHPDKVYEALADHRVDVGIVSFPLARRDLEVIPWRREEMVLACAPDHPFAKAREVDPVRLAGEDFVAFDKGLGIRREVDRFLRTRKADVKVSLEFDNIEAIKQAVEIGAGVSLLPAPTLDREVKSGALASVPLKGKPFFRSLGILRRRGRTLNPSVDEFIAALQKDAATGDTAKPAGAQ